MPTETFTIGQLARAAGVNASAIRYYEAKGVLPEPERQSGQRRYDADALRRLQVIDVAKRAGFTLEEAAVLLATDGRGNPAHAQLRELAMRKLPEVEALIERAQAMRDWLDTATGCDCETLDVCALFDDARLAPAVGSSEPVKLQLTHVGSDGGVEPL